MTWSTDNKPKHYAPPIHTLRLLHLRYRSEHELLLLCGWYFKWLIIACTFVEKYVASVINCGWSSVKWCLLTYWETKDVHRVKYIDTWRGSTLISCIYIISGVENGRFPKNNRRMANGFFERRRFGRRAALTEEGPTPQLIHCWRRCSLLPRCWYQS